MTPAARRPRSPARATSSGAGGSGSSAIIDERSLLHGHIDVVITRNRHTGTRAVELRCRRPERVTRIAIFPHQLTAVLDALEEAEELLVEHRE